MFTIYSTQTCTYCKQAKQLIENKGFKYEEHTLTSPADVVVLSEKVGYPVRTVPQIWYEDQYIGGYDKLVEYFNANIKAA